MLPELNHVFLAFLEGFVLILSPCILSILPIILAGSLVGSRKRSVGIIVGFTLTFTLLALFTHQLVQYSGIDLNLIRYAAYGILLVISVILMSNYLTERFNQLLQRLIHNRLINTTISQEQGGFFRGVFLGVLVAIIWTPCAGPILAAILVQIAIQKTTIISFFTLLSFTLGAVIPMFIITLYGFKIKNTFLFFKTRAVVIRKILGVIILLNVAYMICLEKGVFPAKVVNYSSVRTANFLEEGLWYTYRAPEISGIETWINSPPLQLSALKGKVVLIDFWTYSCINCIRTLPYLKSWYDRYHDKGLVIIGVHTPEFNFEKNVENVKQAVKNYDILYPVALDNLYVTWQNYANRYWPAHYLINQQGEVIYEHFGEGAYDVTENNIRFLLGIDKKNSVVKQENRFNGSITAETYLGYGRAQANLSPKLIDNQSADYHFPTQLAQDSWGLQGNWYVTEDKISSVGKQSSLKIHFKARRVFIVMGRSSAKPIQVHLLLNGKPLQANKGKDVVGSSILVDHYSLYEAVVLPQADEGLLEVRSDSPGLEMFTFTFGA